MKFFFPFLLLTLGAGIAGCYYDNKEELHPELLIGGGLCDTSATIRYNADILPVLTASCGANNSCHGPNNTSGIALSDYTGIHAKVLDGRLWSSIVWDGGASFMPKGSASKLNACSQAKILKWINQGAPNN